MRARGISYDTGFFDHGFSTHEPWDPEVVARELRVIRDDLHCNAVRLIGSSPDRLMTAASLAADLGLEVWLCPWTSDFTQSELHSLLVDLAARAEPLRARTEVVMVLGAELCLLTSGFLPGDTIHERIEGLSAHRAELPKLPTKINAFLGRAVAAVREVFDGKVTYASIPFEGVDWTPFDIVGVDAHRTAEVADIYPEAIRKLVAQGKPVAITEFGCATFKGAGAMGARAAMIVEYDGYRPARLKGQYERDEQEQAEQLRELIGIYEDTGVDAAFVFTFANFPLTGPLDLASYGVVEAREDRTWTPKAAFAAVAESYAKSRRRLD
ncbi:hypothetical protein [Lentzea sp. NBRC 105346]|uniref:hypothetical protein n=1 Tax=Lentzea sp. NBRC 105346 TaxID=3032205 RepID=UPI0025567AB9|nr:hypothetical protein [Lentzea sp. NBRC 105346]